MHTTLKLKPSIILYIFSGKRILWLKNPEKWVVVSNGSLPVKDIVLLFYFCEVYHTYQCGPITHTNCTQCLSWNTCTNYINGIIITKSTGSTAYIRLFYEFSYWQLVCYKVGDWYFPSGITEYFDLWFVITDSAVHNTTFKFLDGDTQKALFYYYPFSSEEPIE